MPRTYHTTQGDREPITDQITVKSNRQPADLTGRDVTFIARHSDGTKVVDALATIVNARQGYVSYELSPTQTAKAGRYDIEWVISGGANDPTTYPADAPDTLVIREDVELDDAVVEELPPDRTVGQLNLTELNGAITNNQPITNFDGPNVEITNGVFDVVTGTTRTDEEIQDVVGALIAGGTNVTVAYDDVANTLTISAADATMTDAEIQAAINADADHGSTAPHNYFSGNHDALTGVSEADHRTDANVVSTINGDGVQRQLWVIPNGGATPAGADADDLIFEREV